ncbi:MAG: hypothetical protein PSX81_04525 [bacterium]|nr:hypothetical protein [bacterium]
MKPIKVLIFLVACLLTLGVISLFFPVDGISYGDGKKISFPNLKTVISPKIDSTAIFAEQKKTEDNRSLVEKKEAILKKVHRSSADTLLLMQVDAIESPARFYFANDDRKVMDQFFEALENSRRDNTTFRIIHYGDSQIEMDRISSHIREQLQRTYGGSGMGLLPAMEVTPKYTVSEEIAGAWVRKLAFGTEDGRAKHNRYGPMAYFCQKQSDVASVVITARENTSFKNKNFKTCKVVVGSITKPLEISIAANGKTIGTQTLQASTTEQLAIFNVDSTNGKIGLKFNGANADILGIALDGDGGICVDNVPMRGCSGTIFKRINAETLRKTYSLLGVKMLILQFGGNALPGMKSKGSADAYGKKFLEELKYLKSVDPNLILFVIGPADMSIKVNGTFQTHPYLENVRDALKAATLQAGGVFWDMYEAMGGNGSMVTWVKAKPSLGSPDYIHYTQKGAVKISEIFYSSLMKEYEMFKLRKTIGT